MSNLKEQIEKQLATRVAERLTDKFLEEHSDWLHDVTTEVCDEELGGLVDPMSDDYYDLVMQVASRISIVAF
jgi:hypothetical protein